jgi:hypothetical protein
MRGLEPLVFPHKRREGILLYQLGVRQISCQRHSANRLPNRSAQLLNRKENSFSLRSVDQFLARDAIANPWNCFQALAVNLLPTVQAFAEYAFIDPLQCGIH